jgi:signal transduction histidine kinase
MAHLRDARPGPPANLADVPASALEALDEATRAIAGVLDVEDVLQLIADRVRTLIGARYAALGIVTPSAGIESFITSGVSSTEREAIGPPPAGHGLLGLLILEGRSIRTPRIASHPASVGFPPNHPPMTSFLGVPVRAGGHPIGNLYLTDKQGNAEFTASDERLAEMFATHAGIAIENARLHAQVRDLAVVEERDRISRDLHDGIIQSLYAVSLSLEDVTTLPPADAEAHVDRAIDSIHEAIRDIRHFIHGLSGEATDGRDLSAGLMALANETRRNALLEVDVEIDPRAEPRLSEEHGAQVLQLVREALSNAVRHGRPSRIVISLGEHGAASRVEVVDDGAGFDPATVRGPGRGLANMRARAAAAGADMWIESRPGSGTRVIITMPRATVTQDAPT